MQIAVFIVSESAGVETHTLETITSGIRRSRPLRARWLTRDPIEEQVGMNLYGFANSTAVLNIDILGLKGVIRDLIYKACCNGKKYYRNEHCCLKNSNGVEELVSRTEVVNTELVYVELRGRWYIPLLLQYAWPEAPYITGGSAGFYPANGSSPISLLGEIKKEDPSKYNNWGNFFTQSKSKTEIILNRCEYDVGKFKICIKKRIDRDKKLELNYIVLFYRDCEIWANDLIADCKSESKR